MIPGATVRLKDIVCLADTGTWGTEAAVGAGVPVLRSSNIQNGELTLEDVAWRELPAEQRVTKRLEDGDLIVTMSSGSPAHIGKCCIFRQPSDGRAYYFSNFTLRLRVRSDIADPAWLSHWLSSPAGRSVLDAMNSTTSGLRNLSRPRYLAQKMSLPPLLEQRRIAAILDKADAVCRKRQQTLDLADQFLRSAFLDMFGDPVTNPKGWPRLALREICQRITVGVVIRPASYYRPVGIPALRSQNIRGGEVSVDNLVLVSPDDNETRLAKSRIWAGDVVAVRTGQPGSAAVVPQGLDGANAIDILIVTPDKARLSPFYLCQFLNSVGGTRAVAASQRGQIQKHMNATSLQQLRLPLPPLCLQERYAAVTAANRMLLEATRTAARQVEQVAATCQVLGFHGAL